MYIYQYLYMQYIFEEQFFLKLPLNNSTWLALFKITSAQPNAFSNPNIFMAIDHTVCHDEMTERI